MKWCWSRLPGGVVTWETYELFKVGEIGIFWVALYVLLISLLTVLRFQHVSECLHHVHPPHR